MAELDEQIKAAEDKLRDLKNWVAEFANEENLSEYAVGTLNERIDELAVLIGNIGQ
ncbi:MAG: hypothetical protein KAT43_03850 [Nanoarchaeota archaeon]|nr:hypothetical protein [Nanoarchaeota archaeon]